MRTKECPKCGAEMYCEDDDPDVGIVGGWSCTSCEHTEPLDLHEGDDE